MFKRIFLPSLLLLVACISFNSSHSQAPTWTIDLLGKEKKPEKFENRKLGSEKMADKKFTVVRHFFQNTYTHYNYYYNANNKITSVIERAKAVQKDDYSKLLSYYPYTLENTASQKSELDSVIFKATAGILLHDLRNDWIDNMYLLMGKAFYLRRDFDSAAATFQFINYNLFPRDKNEEDSRIVGTSDAAANGFLSIANKEKRNILQKATAKPPSRNDALIWMVRTLIEQNEFGEAAGLINILEYDPNLPKRLQNDLDNINAYWFYKQDIYDSAAHYLEKSLTTADNKQDLARAEFLLAQLYENTRQFNRASEYYEKVSVHTVDPLMDIHARLNNAKMIKGRDPAELAASINNLVKMAGKDRFEGFRDILYFSAGDLALQQPDTAAAIKYFNKSIQYNEINTSYRNKAFLALGDIAYDQKAYRTAFAMYDSLQAGDTTLADRMADIKVRRDALAKIVEKIIIIERQDSLQLIAAMDPVSREVLLKKMGKRLRKERGIKEEDVSGGTGIAGFEPIGSSSEASADLFASSAKGDWYFYNTSVKSKGFAEFKRKWGDRNNVDNWRRKAAMDGSANLAAPVAGIIAAPDDIDKPSDPTMAPNDLSAPGTIENTANIQQTDDVSYEGMMANLPLTPEKLAASHHLLAVNLFQLAQLFQTELEDYEQAIVNYHQSLSRYPDSLYNGELYLGLYFCYTKLGYADKAAYYKNLVNKNFANSRSAMLLNNPSAANPAAKNPEVTKRYADIYNLFIEGNFAQAFEDKKNADKLYGNNYWSPQLLYIEAVYHIKQRADSQAISVLTNITALYPSAPLSPKATRMIDILKRRAEIEDYLTKLEITRAKEDEIVKIDERTALVRNDLNLVKSPSNLVDTAKAAVKPFDQRLKDSLTVARLPVVPEDTVVAVIPAVNDTAKAIAKLSPPAVDVAKKTVATKKPVAVIAPVALAVPIDTLVGDVIPSAVVLEKDKLTTINPNIQKEGTAPNIVKPGLLPPVKDSLRQVTTVFENGPFILNTDDPHQVIMIMDKVDGTYVNESRNAFARFLNESFRGSNIVLTRDAIDKDRALLVFAPFANAAAAYEFLITVRTAAPVEVSWLPAAKYSFYLVSEENLQLLKTNKDIPGYIGLLKKVYPGIF